MDIHQIYRPFLRYFRTKRMLEFGQHFRLTPETRILDVGGDPFNWSLLPFSPKLIFLNVYPPPTDVNGPKNWVMADGQHLPFNDRTFDITYSNSVIEHLGNDENQRRFAAECARVGMNYYIQTPNKWFPLEPHLITPCIHWLPRNIRGKLLRNFTLWGLITRPTRTDCERLLNEIQLLDEAQLRQLFQEAHIWREHFIGLTNSSFA